PGRVPLAPRAAGALLPLVRRLAGTRRGVARLLDRERSVSRRVPAPARARGAVADGAGVGGDLHPAAGPGGARGERWRGARCRARRLRSRRGPHLGEAALAGFPSRARARRRDRAETRRPGAGMSREGEAQARAGRLFVAPALGLIGVFFVVPVVAG